MNQTALFSLLTFLAVSRVSIAEVSVPNNSASVANRNATVGKDKASDEYKSFLKAFQCVRADWPRYELGDYFNGLGKTFKLSAYDVANGDAYIRRNISPGLKEEIAHNYKLYTNGQIPAQIADKFYQGYSSMSESEANQKAIFNDLVKRDSGCFKKLK